MNKGVVTTWSPAEDALLHKLYIVEGRSAGLCVEHFEGRTRNSIIGRAHRMGWLRVAASKPAFAKPYPKRAAYKHTRRRNQPAPAFISPNWKDGKALPPTITPMRGADIESPGAGPWIARTARQCAYPVGDETGAGQWSCCNPTDPGQSYCTGHAAIMFNGAPKPNTAYVERKARHQANFREWAA